MFYSKLLLWQPGKSSNFRLRTLRLLIIYTWYLFLATFLINTFKVKIVKIKKQFVRKDLTYWLLFFIFIPFQLQCKTLLKFWILNLKKFCDKLRIYKLFCYLSISLVGKICIVVSLVLIHFTIVQIKIKLDLKFYK